MDFEKLASNDARAVSEMSSIATEIVREHYDPIIGEEQNTYMLEKFQSEDAIRGQIDHGSEYYFVSEGPRRVGFMAFYPREKAMYLSKLYLYKSERGKGYGRQMLNFIIEKAREAGLSSIELNVNKNNATIKIYEKLGFELLRTEKIDIGSGYYMDDYVYCLKF